MNLLYTDTELFTDDCEENMNEKKTDQHTMWASLRKEKRLL